MRGAALSDRIQSEGIHRASEKWLEDDRQETGGEHRYYLVTRLSAAMHTVVVQDAALTNPGYCGFSIREADLAHPGSDLQLQRLALTINNAVSWAILEERTHLSRYRNERGTRRKWYLMPLLAPVSRLPYTKVQDALYASVIDLSDWFFGPGPIKVTSLGSPPISLNDPPNYQLELPWSDHATAHR
jgi:hypothetical protein